MSTPKLFYIPPKDGSISAIMARMDELADEYGMKTICYTGNRYLEVSPKPHKLIQNGTIIPPKYMKIDVKTDKDGTSRVVTVINGHYLHYRGHVVFGILIDESKKEVPKDDPATPDKANTYPNCKLCNDTGVIETGNNDLPCSCPAGDLAKFSQGNPITGKTETVSGAEVKKDLRRF